MYGSQCKDYSLHDVYGVFGPQRPRKSLLAPFPVLVTCAGTTGNSLLVDSQNKGSVMQSYDVSLLFVWISFWTNSRKFVNLRLHVTPCDVQSIALVELHSPATGLGRVHGTYPKY